MVGGGVAPENGIINQIALGNLAVSAKGKKVKKKVGKMLRSQASTSMEESFQNWSLVQ